jgi:hypothetical protein
VVSLWNVFVELCRAECRQEQVEASLTSCQAELVIMQKLESEKSVQQHHIFTDQIRTLQMELQKRHEDMEEIETRSSTLEKEMQKWNGRIIGGGGANNLVINRIKKSLASPRVKAKVESEIAHALNGMQDERVCRDLLHRYVNKSLAHEAEVRALKQTVTRMREKEITLFHSLEMVLSSPRARQAPEGALAKHLLAHRNEAGFGLVSSKGVGRKGEGEVSSIDIFPQTSIRHTAEGQKIGGPGGGEGEEAEGEGGEGGGGGGGGGRGLLALNLPSVVLGGVVEKKEDKGRKERRLKSAAVKGVGAVRVEKGNGARPWVVGQILPLGALVGSELVGEETKGREARNGVVRFKKKKGKSAGAETPRFRESGGRCMSVWYDSVQCSLSESAKTHSYMPYRATKLECHAEAPQRERTGSPRCLGHMTLPAQAADFVYVCANRARCCQGYLNPQP